MRVLLLNPSSRSTYQMVGILFPPIGLLYVAAAGGAASGYRVAESMVSELIANKGGELRQDNLLCTAYLIEAMVSPGHPVRGYLMNARLAALRVWQVAIDREKLVDPRRNQELVARNEQAKKIWLAYRYLMKCHLDRDGDPSVERWRVLLGLETPRQPAMCDQPPGR